MATRKNLQKHSRGRAAERFNLRLVHRDFVEISKKISDVNEGRLARNVHPDVVVLERLTRTRTLYAVKRYNVWLPVVYSKSRESIVTILPKERLEKYQHLLSNPPETQEVNAS